MTTSKSNGGARLEDRRFVTGTGCFTDDIEAADALHAIVLRSPHAHARIERIDAEEARSMPGVAAVLTGAEVAADGLGPLTSIIELESRDGRRYVEPPRAALAHDAVRHVGDGVALVIAGTVAQAQDAAEAVSVDYLELPAAADADAALAPGAPVIWPEAPGNLAYDWQLGDGAAVEKAFAGAAHVSRIESTANRLVGNAVEPRAALAVYEADLDRVTLYTTSQGVNLLHGILCDQVLGLDRDKLRLVTRDVGGGFGPKYFLYPEQALVAWAARRLGRSVRWTADRSESFLTDTQAREQTAVAELALDGDGRFVALRVAVRANLGAYLSTFAPAIPSISMSKVATGLYGIGAAHLSVRGAFTNTAPVDAYRGAGKPNAIFLLERLVELAAQETGRDPIELRRRNLVPAAAMPHRTALGNTYDSGDYQALLDEALRLSDWSGFADRRWAAGERGLLLGIGLACYLHETSGITDEEGVVVVTADDRIEAMTGTQSSGQGHETVFARVVAERFGVAAQEVRVVQGDTAAIARGGGTGGSSSVLISGPTLGRAADAAIERGRELAAEALEAAVEDIAYGPGGFTIVGTDRRIGLYDLARRAAPGALTGRAEFEGSAVSAPAGVMVAEVEIDPETGRVRLAGLASAHDVGRMLDARLVEGQMQGGIVQGIGPALMEACIYDRDSGQLLTGSLLDYCLPRADDLPPFRLAALVSPSPNNDFGAKGVGELGANGAPAAIVNAAVDALRGAGIRHLDMPLTSEKVWRALGEAGKTGVTSDAGP